jgi:MFS family permease
VSAPRRSFVRDAFAGFGTVAHDAKLRLLIGLYGTQTLVAGAMNVLIVVLALETLDLGNAGIGFLNSAWGVGGLLGGVAAIGLVAGTRLGSAFGAGLALAGLPALGIALVPRTAPALVFLALAGIGTTIVDVAGLTLLQRSVPDEVLTRVMGVVQSVFVGTLGLGAVIAPGLLDLLGDRWTFAAVGALLPVVAALGWPRLRRLDVETATAPPNAELLRAIAIFRPLPSAVVEQLAHEARTQHVSAGERVIRQGDPGDRFYVLVHGEAEIQIDGQRRQTLQAGDHFGEIALLRNVPRTATVVALGDLELLTIERDDFLAAVTGHPDSAHAAEAVVAARFGSLRPSVASI